jgi:hypothetical protein
MNKFFILISKNVVMQNILDSDLDIRIMLNMLKKNYHHLSTMYSWGETRRLTIDDSHSVRMA